LVRAVVDRFPLAQKAAGPDLQRANSVSLQEMYFQ
jgi:hypothetical protein